MTRINTIYITVISVLLFGCQFNQSVNTDLATGAYSRGNGIGCDDVTMQINEEVVKRNTFIFGEKVNLIFNNISGLTNLNNKTYPALSMYIVKNEKDTVLSYPNLLKNLNEGTDLNPLQLQAHFIAALPYKNQENYMAQINIWDTKGDGTFTYELPFKVKESELLTIENTDLQYSNIYLWNETLKKPVIDKNVNQKHLFILILEGIEGLEKRDEKVYPIFSIDIVDRNGNKILSNPNILSDYESEGVNEEDLKSQLTANITFTDGDILNPCKLIAVVKDKNSSKEIRVTTELEIRTTE